MRLAYLFAAAALCAAPAVAAAQTVIPTARFTSVELHGGGSISIRQAPVQRVTLVRGDAKLAGFDVDSSGKLIIRSCRGMCWGSHQRLEVAIDTPELNGAQIHGGGRIEAHGAFPAQRAVTAAIMGGGDIDMRDVPAQTASAAIHGGGKIFVTAQNSLSAKIFGGGEIRYLGQPTVNSAIHGGGRISPIR